MKKVSDSTFNPRSIAIIGATEDGYPWQFSLAKFPKLFAVNPNKEKVFGVRTYRSILDIPEEVDFAIINVPAFLVPKVVEECVKKGVRTATIFSSGFSEVGKIKEEREIVEIAKKGNLHIIGPNCMGIYYPKNKIAFRPDASYEVGKVSFISQSGGHAISFSLIGATRGIYFSKVVSYGNACDLDSTDFLEYLIDDPETEIIAIYIEGVEDGRKLIKLLKESKKPVIVLKGGQTDAGHRATQSHTGSIAGSMAVWDAVFSQTGVVKVRTFEELVDTVLAFLYAPIPRGKRAGIITISGGQSVLLTDGFAREGLEIPEFSDDTKKTLAGVIQNAGTSVKNPVDMAGAWGHVETIYDTIRTIEKDKNVDLLILEVSMHYSSLYALADRKYPQKLLETIKKFKKEAKKPFFIVLSSTPYENDRLKFDKELTGAGMPVYPSIQRAARAIMDMVNYKKGDTLPINSK